LSTQIRSGIKSPWLSPYKEEEEEEEKIKQEKSELREWTEENNEMGNICDPYYKL